MIFMATPLLRHEGTPTFFPSQVQKRTILQRIPLPCRLIPSENGATAKREPNTVPTNSLDTLSMCAVSSLAMTRQQEIEALTELRTANGLSRGVLAPRIGVTERSLFRWEMGAVSPSWAYLRAWRGALEELLAERQEAAK